MRFDHCVIHVSDWTRSNAFYRDVLGAELIGGDPDGPAAYRFGAQQLNVHGPGVEPDPVARDPVRPGNSDLCRSLLARVPAVCLFVRPENAPAIRVYDGIGMRRTISYRSLVF